MKIPNIIKNTKVDTKTTTKEKRFFLAYRICLLSVILLIALCGCGDPAIHVAAYDGKTQDLKNLIAKGENVNLRNADKRTPLHYAAQEGHIDIVRLLIENGAEVNAKDTGGWTPLHLSCHTDRIESTRILIEKGADVNIRSSNYWTPLHSACAESNTKFAKLLIEKGANVNARNRNNSTPLRLACETGQTAVVKLLIEKGADLKAREKSVGATPLFVAAQFGHADIVKLLLMHGANPDDGNKNGYKPIQIAKDKNHRNVVEILEKKVVTRSEEENEQSLAYRRAAKEDSIEAYEEFLSRFPHSPRAQEARERMAVISERETFLESVAKSNTIDEIRKRLAADDAKAYITSVTVTRIEDILIERIVPIIEGQECFPAFKASPDGNEGRVTISQQGGIFGMPYEEGRMQWIIGGTLQGEFFLEQQDGSILIVKTEYPGDSIPTIGKPTLREDGYIVFPKPTIPNADGSVHRFAGTVKLGSGYTFVSNTDKLNRLTFILTEECYVYLRGEGIVMTPEGKTIVLPSPKEVPKK